MSERELSATEVQEWKRVDKQIESAKPMTPHQKASEMAKEIVAASIHDAQCDGFAVDSNALGDRISLALTPLLEEIESLKLGQPYEQPLVDMPLDRQIVMLNRQLTATEAKLEKLEHIAGQLYRFRQHNAQCEIEDCEFCTCGMKDAGDAYREYFRTFLSTLQTAETKGGKEK